MIEDAEKNGRLKAGGVIVEPTSGNTGIALAAIAAQRGYRAIFTMPDTMSVERRMLLTAYGAQVVLTEGAKGMKGAIEKAQEIAAQTAGAIIPGQFENPANPAAHEKTTGPEIWADTEGKVDALVAGVGTGGTLTGTGRYLKKQNGALRVVAVEPESSAVLSGQKPGKHGLMGIGAGFIPKTLDTGIYDEIIKASDADAYRMSRLMAKKEGVLVGISSGAALYAAYQVAARPEMRGKTIVAVLVDSGERYLSTPLYRE
jgi:cysteine synthase A